ncbi:response regulator [Nodosilinea sp. LEGE 07298]|uniref:response regulator n=1 Tax=Nodosilinea sp. LEGE 07298 TaxID=2777970 RepID=UPI001881F720|nr:response regulator [Nodosilinea sp. LEGE 07298]MBE9112925.1 response regulator [Nodosilinea sp. LEGE 07298]
MKILLVEDDLSTRDLLVFHLTAARYTVEQTADGITAQELAVLWNYDLILLDVNIPRLDGLSLCRQLRSQGLSTPILMLTAQSGDEDVITGLDAGADDYVTKPFEVSQVLARIRALLRRGARATMIPSLVWGQLCLDPTLAQVTYGDQVVPLTPKEYSLLELFLRHPQRVFSRSTILDHLWTIDDSPTEGAVTNLVKDLRNRLRRSGVVENVIQTVYGLGYRLRDLPSNNLAETAVRVETALRSLDAGGSHGARGINGAVQQSVSGPGAERISIVPEGAGKTASLEAIAARFQASLQARLALVEAAVRSLQAGDLPPQQRVIAQDEAHRLAGGLGTFGYEEGSTHARQIEQLLGDSALQTHQIDQISRSLLALKQTLALTPKPPERLPERSPDVVANSPANTAPVVRHWGVALSVEPELLNRLQTDAVDRGWHLDRATSLTELMQVLAQGRAEAVVMTLDQEAALADKLAPLREVKHRYPRLPVMVLTCHESLEERVQVARLQGDRYLVAPATPRQVFDSLDQLLPDAQAPESQVMVVDNDPVTCAAITELLTPWGLQVTELGDPSQFWEVLRQTQPDLLLLALEMPTFSGIDLCQVVRQDSRFGNLPILMVAAHPDTVTVRQVFEVGGDDLIGKPIVGPELVTRVLSRIERSRLRQQIEQMRHRQALYWDQQNTTDLLTQVANGPHFDAFLQQQWERHCQDQAPISLILCSPDHLRPYYQIYGQQAGDAALRRIARTLHRTINPNIDLVARCGDEEFAVVLPNTNLDGALRVVSRMQQAVSDLKIPCPAATAEHITLSLGIGGTTPTKTLSSDHLLKTADQALQDAKVRGGNTFCLYPMC